MIFFLDFFFRFFFRFFLVFILFLFYLFQNFRFFKTFLKEKKENFECGFDSFFKKKEDFCIRFFNFAILFLLIDLEIALFLPFFQKIFLLNIFLNKIFFCRLIIVVFLLILLFFEFFSGRLI